MNQQHLALVRNHYPNATTTNRAVVELLALANQHLNLLPHQIMLADSICCDDVNTIEYPQEAYDMLGPFKMGGLNGFPFAGVTGMGAFAGHVPDEGAVLVFYAPHIGINKTGTLGEISRIGQTKKSGCCGAARAALNKLLNNQIESGHITELDYQMNTIEQIFLKSERRIKEASNSLFEATEVMYEAIDERIHLLVEKTQYPCKYVLLIGSILINGDHDMGSFCSYKRFDFIDLATKQTTNLLDSFLAKTA